MERLIPIQVRMLDNVIDLNALPVPQATITNRKYRAIGLGTFGWHHLLAQQAIQWDSPDAEHWPTACIAHKFPDHPASAQLAKKRAAIRCSPAAIGTTGVTSVTATTLAPHGTAWRARSPRTACATDGCWRSRRT